MWSLGVLTSAVCVYVCLCNHTATFKYTATVVWPCKMDPWAVIHTAWGCPHTLTEPQHGWVEGHLCTVLIKRPCRWKQVSSHTDRGTAEFIVPSVKADQTQRITKIMIAARLFSRSSDSVLIFVRLSLWLTVHLSFKGDAAHCSHSFSHNASLHHSLCHVFSSV